MEIYVVTAGSYSDYHIVRVFTEREKAEKYITVSGIYEANNLEEYETSDDLEFKPIPYIKLTWRENEKVLCDFDTVNDIDVDMGNFENTQYYEEMPYNNPAHIVIKRILPLNYDPEAIKQKYIKACQDIYRQIKAEGWTGDHAYAWLEKNKCPERGHLIE
jgi:hypothetical protein